MPAESPPALDIEDRDLADAAAAAIRLDAEVNPSSSEVYKGMVEVELPSLEDDPEARMLVVQQLLVKGAIVRTERHRSKSDQPAVREYTVLDRVTENVDGKDVEMVSVGFESNDQTKPSRIELNRLVASFMRPAEPSNPKVAKALEKMRAKSTAPPHEVKLFVPIEAKDAYEAKQTA